jgi:hypothetical protein
MAVIETIHELSNHAAKKGFIGVHIMFIKPVYPRLSERIESVEIDLKGISHATDCIVG